MIARRLTPKPLTAAAFAAFGDVIEIGMDSVPRTINYGHTLCYSDIAHIDVDRADGRPSVSIFRSTPLPAPLAIRVMERHPLSSQTFVPLSGRPYLSIVAPHGEFDPERIEVFLAASDQGVNYGAGVWHHFCLALGVTSDFLVIDRTGPGDNCDEVAVDPPFEITLES